MRRFSLLIPAVVFAARSAHADAAAGPAVSAAPAAVAATAPSPAFTAGVAPAATPVAPSATLDSAAAPASPTRDEPENELRGFVLDFGTGLLVPWGEYSQGSSASSFGLGAASTVKVGVYVSPHIGLGGGVRFSYKHPGSSSCNNQEKENCGGYTYQFPLMAEYAFGTRKTGPYAVAGLGLLSTYRAYGFAHTLKVSSPFDYKLGFGYRWSQHAVAGNRDRPSRLSFDVYANFDFGQFDHGESDGHAFEIASPSMHYMAELGAALRWTP